MFSDLRSNVSNEDDPEINQTSNDDIQVTGPTIRRYFDLATTVQSDLDNSKICGTTNRSNKTNETGNPFDQMLSTEFKRQMYIEKNPFTSTGSPAKEKGNDVKNGQRKIDKSVLKYTSSNEEKDNIRRETKKVDIEQNNKQIDRDILNLPSESSVISFGPQPDFDSRFTELTTEATSAYTHHGEECTKNSTAGNIHIVRSNKNCTKPAVAFKMNNDDPDTPVFGKSKFVNHYLLDWT